MSDRSGHSVYFSDDLRERVDDWAEDSNLSKADIYDEALRFFFEHHEIDAEGHVALTDEYRENLTNSAESERELLEQVLENQEALMGAIENEGVLDSGTVDQNKNSEQCYRDAAGGDGGDGYEHLRGRYDHDECIDPDDVRPGEIKQTRKMTVPILVGILNWKREREGKSRIKKSELIETGRLSLGMTDQTVRNYIDDELIPRGIIYPHPSIDPNVVDGIDLVRARAGSATDSRDATEIEEQGWSSSRKRQRYGRQINEFVAKYVANWDRKTYYLDRESYLESIWTMLRGGIRNIAVADKDRARPNGDDESLNEKERAYGASAVLRLIGERWMEIAEVDIPQFHPAVAGARRADGDGEVKEWVSVWEEVVETVESHLGNVGEEQMDEERARDVLGVDEDADEEEVKQAWADYALNNHPDSGGEMEADEFHEMKAAKDVLLD